MRHGTVCTLALLGLLGWLPSAVASTPADAQAADQLFREGKDAMTRGDLASACADFARSQKLDPAPGTLLNLAECEARSGKLAAALGDYEVARAELAAGDFRITFAETRIAELGKRVAKLSVRVEPPSAADVRVTCDGVTLDPASMGTARRVDPGAHVCVVHAPGHTDASTTLTLAEGQELTAALTLGPAVGSSAAVASPPAAAAPPESSPWRVVGLATAGAGVLGVGVGAFFGILSKVTYDDAVSQCPRGVSSCTSAGANEGRTANGQATVSTLAFIAGGALLATGAVIYFTAPKPGTARVGLAAAPGQIGVGGSW